MDIALFLQGLQMRPYAIGRANAERHTNLADARWHTRRAHLPFNVIENLSLSVRKDWSHALSCLSYGSENIPCAVSRVASQVPAHMSNTAHLSRCQAENASMGKIAEIRTLLLAAQARL